MKTIKVSLEDNTYNIFVGEGAVDKISKSISSPGIGRDAYIITNARVRKLHGDKLARALKTCGFSVHFELVPDTEKSKSPETAFRLLRDLARYSRRKKVFIVAFGGGVIGDLAGFVASIYKRGIPYIQVPTTLLAQVDSGIGGKTGVDLPDGKNLIGTFYQPRLVVADVSLLSTLSFRQMQEGMAEVIKYAVIKDKPLFNYLERRYLDVLSCDTQAMNFIVSRCASIKAEIVGQDEKETKGIRTVLNFGHTIGHAIEAAGGYGLYSHGQAIALGMLAAGQISAKLGLLSGEDFRSIEDMIKKCGLPEKIRKISVTRIIKAYYHDKKFIGSRNRFVLVKGIGRPVIREDIPLSLMRGILKKLK